MEEFLKDLQLLVKGMFLLTAFTVLVAVYVHLSQQAYEEEQFMQKEYIQNVCYGYHPNYKQLTIDCDQYEGE